MHTRVHVHIHTYMHAHTYTHLCTDMDMDKHTHTHGWTHAETYGIHAFKLATYVITVVMMKSIKRPVGSWKVIIHQCSTYIQQV